MRMTPEHVALIAALVWVALTTVAVTTASYAIKFARWLNRRQAQE